MGLSMKSLFGNTFEINQEYSVLSSKDPEVIEPTKASTSSFVQRNSSRLGGYSRFKVFLIFATISVAAALAMLVFAFLGWNMCSTRHSQYLLKTPVPSFAKEIRYFEWNQTYVDPPSPESDIAWNKLLPDGRGYIYVENGAQYDMEPGVIKESGEIYGVSMFHQIHCLGVIRRAYYDLAMGLQDDDIAELKETAKQQLLNEHIGHCFDYLRQAFECSADMTLEWPRTEKDGSRFQTDGRGIPHEAIMDFMEIYGYRDAKNHDIAA
ncbi:hypothetical protein N7528_008591 [Penicillium herquei]|nr:hypothetical protein N7528_008591 [Penicillium herquei]